MQLRRVVDQFERVLGFSFLLYVPEATTTRVDR